jgi:hypothetical protein
LRWRLIIPLVVPTNVNIDIVALAFVAAARVDIFANDNIFAVFANVTADIIASVVKLRPFALIVHSTCSNLRLTVDKTFAAERERTARKEAYYVLAID